MSPQIVTLDRQRQLVEKIYHRARKANQRNIAEHLKQSLERINREIRRLLIIEQN